MKLIAPAVDVEDTATPVLLQQVVEELPKKPDPYLILEHDEMTYVQAVWDNDGYWLEYQDGDIERHFRAVDRISDSGLLDVLTACVADDYSWKNQIAFEKKEIKDSVHASGHKLGTIVGRSVGFLRSLFR